MRQLLFRIQERVREIVINNFAVSKCPYPIECQSAVPEKFATFPSLTLQLQCSFASSTGPDMYENKLYPREFYVFIQRRSTTMTIDTLSSLRYGCENVDRKISTINHDKCWATSMCFHKGRKMCHNMTFFSRTQPIQWTHRTFELPYSVDNLVVERNWETGRMAVKRKKLIKYLCRLLG